MTQNTLVSFVYETIENPQKRRDFVATFAEVINAPAVGILVQDRQNRWARFCDTHGMDHEACRSYTQYYVGREMYSSRVKCDVGETRSTEGLLTVREVMDTELYHGWLKPRGWFWASGVVVHATDTEFTSLFAIRPLNRPFTEGEMALYNNLSPHLARAAQIEKRLAELKDTISSLRASTLEIDALASLNLSLSESRIALALFKGQTPKEYAHSAHVTADTVRWHTKRIYKKLGVHSKTDFKQLLLERFKH